MKMVCSVVFQDISGRRSEGGLHRGGKERARGREREGSVYAQYHAAYPESPMHYPGSVSTS